MKGFQIVIDRKDVKARKTSGKQTQPHKDRTKYDRAQDKRDQRKITETRVLTTVHLTDNQKKVLSTIRAAATPTVAVEQISGDDNMNAAKKELLSLQLIAEVPDGIEITEKGMEIMKDANLVDNAGELTADGKKNVAGAKSDTSTEQPNQSGSFENYALLKDLMFFAEHSYRSK
jgi:hypothetical protein